MYWWDLDENQNEEKRFVNAQEVIDAVKRLTSGPSKFVVQRAIITDGVDCTNFEWTHKDGVIFPLPL